MTTIGFAFIVTFPLLFSLREAGEKEQKSATYCWATPRCRKRTAHGVSLLLYRRGSGACLLRTLFSNTEIESRTACMKSFTLELLSGTFAVCRLDADAQQPNWATGEVVSITRTPNELSIVCSQNNVPATIQSERDWRCLRVVGPLAFSMVGVIASLTTPLAKANVGAFVLSTYDADLLLVKQEQLDAALESLQEAGHTIMTSP